MPCICFQSSSIKHNLPSGVRGFTLFEILIVMVIISIVLTLALLPVSLASRSETETEARRLAALLRYAVDDAVMTSSNVGIILDAHGYRFLSRGKDGWMPINSKILRERKLPDTLSLRINNEKPGSTAPNAGKKTLRPNIIISADGESTPASISIHGPEVSVYSVAIDAGSNIALEGEH